MRKIIDQVSQDMIDYYFPTRNWENLTSGLMVVTEFGQKILECKTQFASCVRCGSLVIQAQWPNHINWHANALG